MKTVLMTGVTGFLGQHLSRKLLKSGWKIHSLQRKKTCESPGIISHHYEIGQSNPVEVLKGIRPDAMIHLAATHLDEDSFKNLEEMTRVNVQYGVEVFAALRALGVHCPVINTGTYWQFDENGNCCPNSYYAATKQAFQDLLMYMSRAASMPVVTMILYDVYGEGDRRPKFLSRLFRGELGKGSVDATEGHQQIYLTHVEDVVEGYMLVLNRLISGKILVHDVFALRSTEPLSLREIVSTTEKTLGIKFDIRWGAIPYPSHQLMRPSATMMCLPDWNCTVDLGEGIRRLASSNVIK